LKVLGGIEGRLKEIEGERQPGRSSLGSSSAILTRMDNEEPPLTNSEFYDLHEELLKVTQEGGDDATDNETQDQSTGKRSRKECEDLFAKHARRRKLTSGEMRDWLDRRKPSLRRRSVSDLGLSVTSPEDTELLPPEEYSKMASIWGEFQGDLREQQKIWQKIEISMNDYDLSEMQSWIECNVKPNLVLWIRDSPLPDPMIGTAFLCLYLCTLMSMFPVLHITFAVEMTLDKSDHTRLLEMTKNSGITIPSDDDTICFQLTVRSDMYRVCYQSTWDVMSAYIREQLKTPRPMRDGEVISMLHGDSELISYYQRKPDCERIDGKTDLVLTAVVLATKMDSTNPPMILAIDIIQMTMLVVPELDA